MLSTSLITCALIAAIRLATERHGWLVPAFPQLPMSVRVAVARVMAGEVGWPLWRCLRIRR
jgi:hypothetical protein